MEYVKRVIDRRLIDNKDFDLPINSEFFDLVDNEIGGDRWEITPYYAILLRVWEYVDCEVRRA